jgi:hypothetical protein
MCHNVAVFLVSRQKYYAFASGITREFELEYDYITYPNFVLCEPFLLLQFAIR